jgi:hypothetical protein
MMSLLASLIRPDTAALNDFRQLREHCRMLDAQAVALTDHINELRQAANETQSKFTTSPAKDTFDAMVVARRNLKTADEAYVQYYAYTASLSDVAMHSESSRNIVLDALKVLSGRYQARMKELGKKSAQAFDDLGLPGPAMPAELLSQGEQFTRAIECCENWHSDTIQSYWPTARPLLAELEPPAQ